MRVREAADGLSIHAIAGTDVVLFGLDVSPEAAKGLLGFEIERSGGGRKEFLYGGMESRDGRRPDGRFSDSRTTLSDEVNALPPARAEIARSLADDDSWTGSCFKRGTKESAEHLLFRGT